MNLSVKQILRQKNIPYDIEKYINKYLPDFDQEMKKKHMIKNYRFKCLFLALIQLFSLQMLFSKRKRFKYFAFYQGVLSGLNEN